MAIADWYSIGVAIDDPNTTEVPEVADYHPEPNGQFHIALRQGANPNVATMVPTTPPWTREAYDLLVSLEFELINPGNDEFLLAIGDDQNPDQLLAKYFRLTKWRVDKLEINRTINGNPVTLKVFQDTLTWRDMRTLKPAGKTFWRWL